MKVLVVGDIMVDRYTYVTSSRKAPEAPIPVWDELSHENRLGGAANVAHNLKALGGDEVEVFLAGIVDSADRKMISRLGIDTVMCTGFETMRKHRYVDEGSQIIFRCDDRRSFRAQSVETFEACLQHFRGHLFDSIIFSDYDKGTITRSVVDELAPAVVGGLTVVDSKRVDLSMFRGAHVLKVNEHEYSAQVSRGPYTNVEELFRHVVVTQGARGAQLRQSVQTLGEERAYVGKYIVNSEDFPTISVPAKDVTGCGDTHTAALTFALLKNGDIRNAVKFANECARDVVQRFGTSAAQPRQPRPVV